MPIKILVLGSSGRLEMQFIKASSKRTFIIYSTD